MYTYGTYTHTCAGEGQPSGNEFLSKREMALIEDPKSGKPCVCVCVCMYACMCVRTYVCMCACM